MTDKLILLVEDNPSDIGLAKRAFQKNSPNVKLVVAVDGQEALDYLFKNGIHAECDRHEMPSVILLDLKLPRIDGLEVLRRLRVNQRTRHIPVVILTSSCEEQDITAGYALGANSYIRKPVDFHTFDGVIKQLGMYWLVTNQPPPDDSWT